MICKKYFAQRDALGFPIPGTMVGYDSAPCNRDCALVELPTEEPEVDVNQVRVFHPQGMRYFYRSDCDGLILANSLIATPKHPGTGVIEYKKIVNV